MREILFRGKRRNGEWVQGNLLCYPDVNRTFISVGDYFKGGACEVGKETVGQYTGLTDKNGKRIFEGDIVKYNEPFVLKSIGVVFFGEHQWNGNTNMGFYVKWVIAPLPDIMRTDIGFWCHERDIEVIGNIHDNPELLKGE